MKRGRSFVLDDPLKQPRTDGEPISLGDFHFDIICLILSHVEYIPDILDLSLVAKVWNQATASKISWTRVMKGYGWRWYSVFSKLHDEGNARHEIILHYTTRKKIRDLTFQCTMVIRKAASDDIDNEDIDDFEEKHGILLRNDARDFAKICGLLRVDYDTVPALKDWKVETYDDDAQEEFSDLENDCIEPEVRRTYKAPFIDVDISSDLEDYEAPEEKIETEDQEGINETDIEINNEAENDEESEKNEITDNDDVENGKNQKEVKKQGSHKQGKTLIYNLYLNDLGSFYHQEGDEIESGIIGGLEGLLGRNLYIKDSTGQSTKYDNWWLICNEFGISRKTETFWTQDAVNALQMASEQYLIDVFKESELYVNKQAQEDKRKKLKIQNEKKKAINPEFRDEDINEEESFLMRYAAEKVNEKDKSNIIFECPTKLEILEESIFYSELVKKYMNRFPSRPQHGDIVTIDKQELNVLCSDTVDPFDANNYGYEEGNDFCYDCWFDSRDGEILKKLPESYRAQETVLPKKQLEKQKSKKKWEKKEISHDGLETSSEESEVLFSDEDLIRCGKIKLQPENELLDESDEGSWADNYYPLWEWKTTDEIEKKKL